MNQLKTTPEWLRATTPHVSTLLLALALPVISTVSKAQEPEIPATKPAAATEASAALGKKLHKIIIPRISFEDCTLMEALDFLRARSTELEEETDPVRKGVNFVIRRPRAGTSASDPGDARIDLDLRSVTLRQALDAICTNTGLVFEVNDYAVVIGFPVGQNEAAKAPEILKGKAAEAAKRIILPLAAFQNAALGEAVEFLNIRFKELSKDAESYPIVLDSKVDATTNIAGLRLDNVPLLEVLKRCAGATQTKLEASDTEIRFTQP